MGPISLILPIPLSNLRHLFRRQIPTMPILPRGSLKKLLLSQWDTLHPSKSSQQNKRRRPLPKPSDATQPCLYFIIIPCSQKLLIHLIESSHHCYQILGLTSVAYHTQKLTLTHLDHPHRFRKG